MKNLNLILNPAFVLLLSSTLMPINAQPGDNTSIDEQSFEIKMYDINIPDQLQDDLLTFKGGKLDSQSCQPYGFKPSKYDSTKQDNKIKFTCTCRSDQEGLMIWNGTISNKSISGDVAWQKDGQKTINYKFNGSKKL
ncbi:MAG: hypothetical protein IPL46_04220 [Saprospiraceae bacterium]|nr:hypothetical protein [Saprospiraceae bacterium]